MSEHTKEPWVAVALDAGRGIVRAAIASKQGPAFAEFYGFRRSVTDRDRAVVCVNYLEGVSTEELERRTAARRGDNAYGVKSLRLIREAAKRGMRLDGDTLVLQTGKPSEAQFDPYLGYRSLNLSVDGDRCKVSLARVICFLAHGEPPSETCTADHINGDVRDDRPANLRWASYSENVRNNEATREATREADRRAVVCVAACAGIPTEVLEALPPTDYARLLALASEAAVAAQSRLGLP